MKTIGVIGCTGRMGQLLEEKIEAHPHFIKGLGFSKSAAEAHSLAQVFSENDCVIDFSQPELLHSILEAARVCPKPLIIGTTGWKHSDYAALLNQAAQTIPIVIAPNTSLGAYLQRHLAKELARILGSEYDIDITDIHHRHKKDIPSGTAAALINDVQHIKKTYHNTPYEVAMYNEGPRPEQVIGLSVQRSGNISGDHSIQFTSADDMITIQHVAFHRGIFAQGALRIVEWMQAKQPDSGLYSMADILELH